MERRKRSKKSTSTVKRSKNNPEISENPSDSKSNIQNATYGDEKLYLFLLPNEVLLYIYNFLSPADLFSVTELKNERLTDLTYSISEADLSSCRTANPLCIFAFFAGIRVNYITKLNLNYYFYMKPAEIVKLVCRCKNLTSLSVVECGLTCKNVGNIVESCDKLEELAWNAEEIACEKMILHKLKRLHLFCDIKVFSAKSVCFAMKSFPTVENLWLHFVPDSVLPFIGLWLWSSCITANHIITVSTLQYATVSNELLFMETVFNSKALHKHYKQNKPGVPVRIGRTYYKPPFLQIRSEAEDISLLSSESDNKYATITILFTPEIIKVSDSLIKCVKEVAGNKLKHLSLQSEATRFSSTSPLPISRAEAIAICDVLEKMFLSSKYITMLNLTTVHFSEGSPIKAITQLIYLKVLSLPSCAFRNSSKVIDFQSIALSNVVSCCPKVEDFTLICCWNNSGNLTEDDVVCIKDWLDLKHLTIYCLVFRTCHFLQKIADSCVKLQSLSLMTVAPEKKCLYTSNVIYVLKKAKNLRLIRINDENFCPVFERFWGAIGECVNLEAICIITESQTFVDSKTVIKEIKKLKYLHVFHFCTSRVSDSLYSGVKQSMREHNVKNIRVEKTWNGKSVYNMLSAVHYYHKQPHFCCQHLHLKDFDLF